MQLDDWVLCRIYNKKTSAEKLALDQNESSMDVPMEAIDEIEMVNQPSSTSIEHSGIEQNGPSSDLLNKSGPSPTSHNGVPPRALPMNTNNISSPNLDFFQKIITPSSAGTPKAPVQNTEFNPISSSINQQWINYNSIDLLSGLHTDSNSSKPSSSSNPILEKEEVQSSLRLETSSPEEQKPFFNFNLEGLEYPFSHLDQITLPDPYQDYFTSWTGSDLPRFYANDMRFC